MLRARSPRLSAKVGDAAMTAKNRKHGRRCVGASDDRPLSRRNSAALAAVFVAFLADALDRDHPLAFRGVEHDHALGRAPGDADAFDARADKLAAVGDQHELVPVLDRERGAQLARLLPDRAVALAPAHGADAFSAATGDAVFVRRRALAVAALGDREHELLGRRHVHITLLAELDGAARLFGVGRALLRLPVDAATDRTRALE